MRGLGNSFSVAFMGVGDHYAEIWYEILDEITHNGLIVRAPKTNFQLHFDYKRSLKLI